MKDQVKKVVKKIKDNPFESAAIAAGAALVGKKIYDKVKKNKNEDN